MGERPVHAVLGTPGPLVLEKVREALLGGGPAVLPLDPSLPGPALRATLAALRPTHLVTAGGVEALPGGVPADGAVAAIIATSGSTGTPKGVELPAAALVASATASLERIGARPGERWLCCLPPSHVSGLQVLVRALLGGTEPVVHERFSPGAVAAAGADHVSLVPTQLRRVLDAGVPLAGLRTVLLGGAAPPPGLLEAARDAGVRVVTTYGMSETCGGCVYDGVPLNGVRVAAGPGGRIRLGGPVLFAGYRLRPDLTAAAMDGGWYVTSDLGTVEGGRLRVLGRADDVINTGGRKVVAGTVAGVLGGHPGVREAVVLGRPHPEWGQEVVAVVVPADPAAPPALAELRAHVKTRLPGYAAPRAVRLVDRLPLLPNGKHDLVAIREEISRFVGTGDLS
ncbi:AMP-binding protein [Sphaerisporangium krabiense]|uniref:O-succinylbenzoic acid--CoA ligase n=1 Tax=Sphaerisporangium krabiense TaxID=763782 RepID=A0A7W8ZCF0_9ACTN|nr:AMP-binding protein [Sphaerisporangium krabiense]MBB5631346.1 O-succinylbenzoic acid--CoA ligase [Sphaerisporangium krabiense]